MVRKVIREVTRRIRLSYLQSLQLVSDERPPEDFTRVGGNYSGLGAAIDASGPRQKAALQDIADTAFPVPTSQDERLRNDSGWVVGDLRKELALDVVSWRVGVRELGLHSFRFAPVSEMVRTPVVSPRPIEKVMLQVDETIPQAFNPTRSWAVYELSADEGRSWHRINPLGKPTRFDERGNVVPRVLTFDERATTADPETLLVPTEGEVRQIRLRITLYADPDVADDRLSPVIHGYELLVFPRGGLTTGEDA